MQARRRRRTRARSVGMSTRGRGGRETRCIALPWWWAIHRSPHRGWRGGLVGWGREQRYRELLWLRRRRLCLPRTLKRVDRERVPSFVGRARKGRVGVALQRCLLRGFEDWSGDLFWFIGRWCYGCLRNCWAAGRRL